MDDKTLGKLLAEVHRDHADYRCPEGVSVSPSSMSVMVDRTGKPVERSDIDHFGFSVRNVYGAQNQFPVITQAERMVDFVSPRRTDGPPNIWDTSGISGNVFANPQASSSAPYPQELNSPWKKTVEEPIHMSTAEKSERPERDQDLRCQSGPSAKDSVIFSGGDYSKNYGADQQRLQISDLHFDKFPTPATFACWKIRFKTEVCTCSQFPTEALQWIKEMELVDSVDELRSSSSTRGISMPNFEVLDARILQH